MKDLSRFEIHDHLDRPYATLNHSVLSMRDIEDIADWCENNGCVYYGIGIVEFLNAESVTMFTLRWS